MSNCIKRSIQTDHASVTIYQIVTLGEKSKKGPIDAEYEDPLDMDCFLRWKDRVIEKHSETFEKRVKRYMEQDDTLSQKEAKSMARKKMKDTYVDQFLVYYGVILKNILDLEGSQLNSDILDDIAEYTGSGMSEKRAIKRALKKKRFIFEELFDDDDSSEDEQSEDDGDGGDQMTDADASDGGSDNDENSNGPKTGAGYSLPHGYTYLN